VTRPAGTSLTRPNLSAHIRAEPFGEFDEIECSETFELEIDWTAQNICRSKFGGYELQIEAGIPRPEPPSRLWFWCMQTKKQTTDIPVVG